MKKGYKYGWTSADGKDLFVYQDRQWWAVTEDFSSAKTFKSVQDCINHWLSKHAFPEQYRHCTTDGYIKYYRTDKQLILF